MTRTLIVDPYTQTVKERDVDFSSLDEARNIVGGYVEQVALASVFPRHALYVDEEARLKRIPLHPWRLKGLGVVFLNCGIIFRTTGTEEADATISVDDVLECVEWL